MISGETSYPRKNLKRAFKTIYFRFGFFFIGGALATGIVIPYNDKTLVSILSGNSSATGTAASSPYVIAMENLGIEVLPHITNALLVTSIFSAGNSYVLVDIISQERNGTDLYLQILRFSDAVLSLPRRARSKISPILHEKRGATLVLLRYYDLSLLKLSCCRKLFCTGHYLVNSLPLFGDLS
jgi:hypothetical protein